MADARAFYVLDFAVAAVFALVVWNVWVLMTEIAE